MISHKIESQTSKHQKTNLQNMFKLLIKTTTKTHIEIWNFKRKKELNFHRSWNKVKHKN
jgi:hypothetical protein